MVLFPSNALTFVRFAAMPWKYRSSKWLACWICRFFASFNRHHVISANKWFGQHLINHDVCHQIAQKTYSTWNREGFVHPTLKHVKTLHQPCEKLIHPPSTPHLTVEANHPILQMASLSCQRQNPQQLPCTHQVPPLGILWACEDLQSEDLMKQIVGYLYTANGGWFQRWFKTSAALHVGMLFCQINFQDVSRVNECVQQSCKRRTAWNGLPKKNVKTAASGNPPI